MAAAEQLITANLNIWSSAIKAKSAAGRGKSNKRELYGIKKLRELILELAVRGLLVSQDPSDEPASELLDKIAAERARLVKDDKVKKQKALPMIEEDEKPFGLPKGWEWVRLASVGIGSTGKTPSTKEEKYFDGTIPFIGPGQITPAGELIEPDKYLSEEGIDHSTEALAGDILMVCIGGSIGKSVVCDKRIAFNQQINAIRPLIIESGYLNSAVSTASFYQSVLEESTGSATPIINRSKWEGLLVPVCPLAEQHRIVAKVDELMAICDQLEQQQESSITAHQTLVQTLLDALTTASERDGFIAAWVRIAEHFDTLFTTEWSVDQLKDTILQLAVMGKLVTQNPREEPASELLRKISERKDELVNVGSIRRQKDLPRIASDSKLDSPPSGWQWTRLGELIELVSGQHLKPQEYTEKCAEGMIPYLTGPAEFGERHPNPTRYTTERRAVAEAGDLLVTCKGSGVGKLNVADRDTFISRQLMAMRPIIGGADYLNLLAQSLNGHWRSKVVGIAIPGISRSDITEAEICLPPEREQLRIVEKTRELIHLCDQLKVTVYESGLLRMALADVVSIGIAR